MGGAGASSKGGVSIGGRASDSGRPLVLATFMRDFDNEFVHFFKNVGMLGGLLVYLAYGPA